MITAPPYTLTNESITVVWQGKPHTVRKGSPHFLNLRKAILEENWGSIEANLDVVKSLQDWAKGKFTVVGDEFAFEGTPLPNSFNRRVLDMATAGEDPTPLFNFWERLQKNPSYRSVQQLYDFLKHEGIPLTVDGCFLAYKNVRQNFLDHHSGKFNNSPGAINQLPRNQVSDDPAVECDAGFHVGALQYARSFNSDGRIVICKIDPMDVVAVPRDSSQHKMRVCKYEVKGLHNGEFLPSTTFIDDKYPESSSVGSDVEVEIEDEAEEVESPEAANDRATDEQAAQGEGQKLVVPRKYQKFQIMPVEQLLTQSIMTLREYAGKGLQIVGASKIPGGKTALVAKILEARG